MSQSQIEPFEPQFHSQPEEASRNWMKSEVIEKSLGREKYKERTGGWMSLETPLDRFVRSYQRCTPQARTAADSAG